MSRKIKLDTKTSIRMEKRLKDLKKKYDAEESALNEMRLTIGDKRRADKDIISAIYQISEWRKKWVAERLKIPEGNVISVEFFKFIDDIIIQYKLRMFEFQTQLANIDQIRGKLIESHIPEVFLKKTIPEKLPPYPTSDPSPEIDPSPQRKINWQGSQTQLVYLWEGLFRLGVLPQVDEYHRWQILVDHFACQGHPLKVTTLKQTSQNLLNKRGGLPRGGEDLKLLLDQTKSLKD